MNNFKTKFFRGTQMIKRKTGKSQTTSDEEYENFYNRVNQQEATLQNFVKHSQQLVENFHAFSSTLHFLAEDMRDLYFLVDQEQKDLAAKFLTTVEDMEKSCVLPFQEAMQSDVVEPFEQHMAKFPTLKEMHKSRKNKQLDYEVIRDKVQSLASKQNQKNPMDLPRAKEKLAHAKEDYEEQDHSTKAAMQDLLEQRTEVFDPAVSNMLLHLIDYKKELSSIVSRVQRDAQHLRDTGGQRAAMSGMSTPSSSSMSDSFSGLDLNESSAAPKFDGTTPTIPRGMPAAVPPSFNNVPIEFECDWYYLNSNVEQEGPFGFLDMKKKYKSGKINGQTHVFGGDMSDWSTLKDFAKLRRALEA